MDDPIRLLDIRDRPLSVDEVYAAVAGPRAGGISIFIGTVREEDCGRPVDVLGYSAHPSATERMRLVAQSVVDSHDLRALAAVHRVGDLAVGDIAVVVAVAAAHRATAMSACRQLIDDLKASVPIWKHQQFTDGTQEWVGAP